MIVKQTVATKTKTNYLDVAIAKKSIADAVVALDGTLTYNETEQTQNVTVTLDGFTVTFDVTDNKERKLDEVCYEK